MAADDTVKPARAELLALAAAVRGPHWAERLDAALSAAANNRAAWPWVRAGSYAARLIFTTGSDPDELRDAVRNPARKDAAALPCPPPPVFSDGLAAIRNRGGAS